MKIKKPNKALNPFDLSPVNIIPIKQARIIIKPKILNIFCDLNEFKIYPQTIQEQPQINAPAIGSSLKKLSDSLTVGLRNTIYFNFSKT